MNASLSLYTSLPVYRKRASFILQCTYTCQIEETIAVAHNCIAVGMTLTVELCMRFSNSNITVGMNHLHTYSRTCVFNVVYRHYAFTLQS